MQAVTQYTFQIEISDWRKLTLTEKFPIYWHNHYNNAVCFTLKYR